jgi:hypothetical protein
LSGPASIIIEDVKDTEGAIRGADADDKTKIEEITLELEQEHMAVKKEQDVQKTTAKKSGVSVSPPK